MGEGSSGIQNINILSHVRHTKIMTSPRASLLFVLFTYFLIKRHSTYGQTDGTDRVLPL